MTIHDRSVEKFFISPVKRYFELELPTHARWQGNPRRRWPLLIALHGYQGDKDSMMRVARRIAAGKMAVMSLQGPNQFFIDYQNKAEARRIGFGWGTTWKTEEAIERHHHDLRVLIELAARRYRADRSRVFLLAFSQACSYNYRFVFSHPRLVRGAIGVCGGLPGDWDTNPRYRRARTHVLHIAATHDEWFPREKNLEFRRRLAERAASLDFRFYNSPHRFPWTSIPHIRKWIDRHL